MLSWLLGIKWWLIGGTALAVLLGAGALWHKAAYVPRAELKQWQQYAKDIEKAYEAREKILKEYENQQELDDAVIAEMEKERETLREKDLLGDNPVCLDEYDVEQLRQFQQRHRPQSD